ncbi:Dynamin-binding protein [Grifola frondosa]|uniref:Dynamin-binding protein n=1 Tax=Grifola frondosa TaxID=5627 RepID=A0A1C7LYF2_GRIFR|nr:Dynamin-binding protein [Grifola frondosa]
MDSCTLVDEHEVLTMFPENSLLCDDEAQPRTFGIALFGEGVRIRPRTYSGHSHSFGFRPTLFLPLHTMTPPASSGSSARTVSTASDSSGSSYLASAAGPPMTREDVRDALGEVLDGGCGEDSVGTLFLQIIPRLEPLYRTYITKHPTALEHLNGLPQTPALVAYLAHTQALASKVSHAWDLPSLLIKPVQRLLKYPLLLGTIIDETPDSHGDKQNLKLAREKMEEVARGVNEGRRRKEVVKEVLSGSSSNSPGKKLGESKAKKKGLNVGVAASISLGRMKSLRSFPSKAKEGVEANQEMEAVTQMGEEVRRHETFALQFSKDAEGWAAKMCAVTEALEKWAVAFSRVIWLLPESEERSEAFDAFLTVIGKRLVPLCQDIHERIKNELVTSITRLVNSTLAPLRLLEAMNTLEPLHYGGLLNLNVSKSRPPPQLLEASQSYVALRAQLFAELPVYLPLLEKGVGLCLRHFELWQITFWRDMRDIWSELWEALKVDEEMNAGAAETLKVWWERYATVEVSVDGLNIVRPPEKRPPDRGKSRRKMSSNGSGEMTSSAMVASVLTALDPLHIPIPSSSSSHFVSPSSEKTRSRNSTDSRDVQRRASSESVHSKKSGKSPRHSSRKHSIGGFIPDEYAFNLELMPILQKPSYSRTKSMPLSPSPPSLKKSHSQGRLLDLSDDISINAAITAFRAAASSESRRRSPSLSAAAAYNIPLSSSPSKSSFPTRSATSKKRPSGGQIPALYSCRVVHLCQPPPGVSYRDLPFFTLLVDDVYDVLQEAGHPSDHDDLPLYVDEGEDCLLLVRDDIGDIGWALASFLIPVD